MNILALDTATKTGWSTNIHGQPSGVIEFPVKRGKLPRIINELGVNNIGASVAQVGQEINLNDSGLT